MRLNGKTAVVTGAAAGIGKGIAAAFAREGANVLIADLDLQTGTAVAAEINATGAKALQDPVAPVDNTSLAHLRHSDLLF